MPFLLKLYTFLVFRLPASLSNCRPKGEQQVGTVTQPECYPASEFPLANKLALYFKVRSSLKLHAGSRDVDRMQPELFG